MYPQFFDMTGFYILMGVGLFVGGLVALAKVGVVFWFMTRVLHRPQYEERKTYPEYWERKERGDTGSKLKTWLGIVATVLGIASTSVGLVKECGPEKAKVEEPRVIYPERDVDYAVPSYSNVCCSQAGNCILMTGEMPVGSPCTCFDLLGNMSPGSVCR